MPSPYTRIVDSRQGKKERGERFFYVDENGRRVATLVPAPAQNEDLIERVPSVILVQGEQWSDIRLETIWPSGGTIADPQLKLVLAALVDPTIHVLICQVTVDLLTGVTELVVGIEGIANDKATNLAKALYMAAWLCLQEPQPGLHVVGEEEDDTGDLE